MDQIVWELGGGGDGRTKLHIPPTLAGDGLPLAASSSWMGHGGTRITVFFPHVMGQLFFNSDGLQDRRSLANFLFL